MEIRLFIGKQQIICNSYQLHTKGKSAACDTLSIKTREDYNNDVDPLNSVITRLHSSRMRTARALTVSSSMLCGGCLLRGVSAAPGGCLLWGVGVFAPGRGVSVPRGVCSGGVSAPRVVSAPRGVCSGGSAQGVSLLWGVCLCSGGSAPGGCVSALGGLLLGGVSAPGGVCIPACTEADTPPF